MGIKEPKSFVLTYSSKNQDVKDYIFSLRENPAVNVTDYICNIIRHHIEMLKEEERLNNNGKSIKNMRFTLDDVADLISVFNKTTNTSTITSSSITPSSNYQTISSSIVQDTKLTNYAEEPEPIDDEPIDDEPDPLDSGDKY